jgi:hypothetical protein
MALPNERSDHTPGVTCAVVWVGAFAFDVTHGRLNQITFLKDIGIPRWLERNAKG